MAKWADIQPYIPSTPPVGLNTFDEWGGMQWQPQQYVNIPGVGLVIMEYDGTQWNPIIDDPQSRTQTVLRPGLNGEIAQYGVPYGDSSFGGALRDLAPAAMVAFGAPMLGASIAGLGGAGEAAALETLGVGLPTEVGGLSSVATGAGGLVGATPSWVDTADMIGSDWATGQATGATGGLLPTNAGGYTPENLAAGQAGGGTLSTVAPAATGAAPTTLSAIPGFSALPTAIQTALSGIPISTAAGIVGALLGGTQGQAADLQTTVTPWVPAQAGIQSGLAATQAQLAKSGSFTPPTTPGASNYNPTLTNEYIQAAIAGALKPLNDQFRTVTMPQIGQNSLANNQFGSSRQAIAEALAANSLQQNSGSIAAQLMNQFTQAQSKDVLATNTLNSDNLWKDFAAKYKSSQDQFNYPWNALSQANNIFQGAGGIARTTTTPMPETPWWQTAIATGGAAAETAKKLFP